MAQILSGKAVAESLNERIIEQVESLKRGGIAPRLAILRVGDRPDDVAYEGAAVRKATALGISATRHVFSSGATHEEVIGYVRKLNADPKVHGVLMLRPLPGHLNDTLVRNTLDVAKDVDGMTDLSTSGVFTGSRTGFAPCTAQSCLEILDHYQIDLTGKNVLVIGRSLVVGRSVAMMALQHNATVQIAHSHTRELAELSRAADVIVACVGRPQMVGAGCLRPGQVVVDVGINFLEDGRMVGDVDFDAAADIVDALTPVPGGVGSVTTSVLCKHVVQAAQRSVQL